MHDAPCAAVHASPCAAVHDSPWASLYDRATHQEPLVRVAVTQVLTVHSFRPLHSHHCTCRVCPPRNINSLYVVLVRLATLIPLGFTVWVSRTPLHAWLHSSLWASLYGRPGTALPVLLLESSLII